jgi:hypothetical protein
VTVDLTDIFDVEADSLADASRSHPALRVFYRPGTSGLPIAERRAAYLRLLKVTADYAAFSVPMLRAAGLALAGGDAEDRAWSARFLEYAEEETDPEGRYGHQVWAQNDMRALGADEAFLSAPAHPLVASYGRFFVDEAPAHPYAILGAKGVLEHVSVRLGDDLVRGVRASAIPAAGDATTFFAHHGVLDLEHVRSGDANLERLASPAKRHQVLVGAYVTAGSYRAFLAACV